MPSRGTKRSRTAFEDIGRDSDDVSPSDSKPSSEPLKPQPSSARTTKSRHFDFVSRGSKGRRTTMYTTEADAPEISIPNASELFAEPALADLNLAKYVIDDNSPEWIDEPAADQDLLSNNSSPRFFDREDEPSSKRRELKRPRTSVLLEFRDYWRELTVLWDMRAEGLGDFDLDLESNLPPCEQCSAAGATLRCTECAFGRALCDRCMLSSHAHLPLHRIQRWTAEFWAECSLASVGLVVHLGHRGKPCPLVPAAATPDSFTIIDISGIHDVRLFFCRCPRAVEEAIAPAQLMENGWWPASFNRPQTATTTRCLKLFHAMANQSKTNIYDFWNGLVRITDGAGTRKVPQRYKELKRTIVMFQHIRSMKRGGRAHDNAGIAGTKPGELAVRCIACPINNVNLPEGWDNAPADERFKYALQLAVDANFKLKRKAKIGEDVPLADGCAYFGSTTDFDEHLAVHRDTREMKHCSSSHQAVSGANAPGDNRFDVNGVGAVICARHLFYRAHGVNDLTRGEQYRVMDYCLFKTLELTADNIITFLISYDIACQWNVHLFKRLRKYGTKVKLCGGKIRTRFAIPKFHLRAHGKKCQENFSLNYTPGVGRTSGEGIETGWADCNGAALATREMSKSGRREALDNLFSAINWRKILSLGPWLSKGLLEAVTQHGIQNEIFKAFQSTYPPKTVAEWSQMYCKWAENPKMANPFHEEESDQASALSQAKAELAQQEAEDIAKGKPFLHETTPSAFLAEGIDLEDQRYVLRQLSKAAGNSPTKRAELARKRNAFMARVIKWRHLQSLYMAGLIHAQPKADSSDEVTASTPPASSISSQPLESVPLISPLSVDAPESVMLWMPSQLPAEVRKKFCIPGLPKTELRLRTASLDANLHHIRRQIRVKSGLLQYKKVHINGPGQRANTRAQDTLIRISEKIDRWAERYRRSREAALELDPDNSVFTEKFLALDKTDLKPPTKEEDELGAGYRQLSWLWHVQRLDSRDIPASRRGVEPSDEEVHEGQYCWLQFLYHACLTRYLGMRVEWAEGRARVRSWAEEIDLRLEEMRRSVTTLLHDAAQWDERKDTRTTMPWYAGATSADNPQPLSLPVSISRGLRAYAARQAAIREGLAISFYNMWVPALKKTNLQVSWPVRLLSLANSPSNHAARLVVQEEAVALASVGRAVVDADYGDAAEQDLIGKEYESLRYVEQDGGAEEESDVVESGEAEIRDASPYTLGDESDDD